MSGVGFRVACVGFTAGLGLIGAGPSFNEPTQT